MTLTVHIGFTWDGGRHPITVLTSNKSASTLTHTSTYSFWPVMSDAIVNAGQTVWIVSFEETTNAFLEGCEVFADKDKAKDRYAQVFETKNKVMLSAVVVT
jgi:hypothetical protein